MEGAGSLLAANYIYNRAEADGLTIGNWNSGMVMQQTLGAKGIRFDSSKFGGIGAPGKGLPVCGIMGFSGLKTLNAFMGTQFLVIDHISGEEIEKLIEEIVAISRWQKRSLGFWQSPGNSTSFRLKWNT